MNRIATLCLTMLLSGDARTITLSDMPGWDDYQSSIVAPSTDEEAEQRTFNLFGLPCPGHCQGVVICRNRITIIH